MTVRQLIALLQTSDPRAEVLIEDTVHHGAPSQMYGIETRLRTIKKKRSGWVAKLRDEIVSDVYKSLIACKETVRRHKEYKSITFQEVAVLTVTDKK